MLGITRTVLAGLGLAPSAFGAALLASHYNGHLYTLSLTTSGSNGTLSIVSNTTGCGITPGWLQLYPEDKTLYCFDESWQGSGFIASFSVADDGRLNLTGQLTTTGNDVHGALYGGPNGKSFVAAVE